MDLMKTEYEFLDLTDVKGADLSSLQSALFQKTHITTNGLCPTDKASPTPSTTSSSTVEGSGGGGGGGGGGGSEGEMAAHSPARPPPYAQPPPPYNPPQWPVPPPNVYVSQVTANVNVHGYMGQYYQGAGGCGYPAAHPAPPERPRAPRRERRPKRTVSPPPPPHHPQHPQHTQPPPYYLQYPQYYHPAQQAQGAPLYHLPMYQPVVYGPYPYPPYYPEYPMPVEGEDKGPDEYAQEVVMEQEAVEAYYAGAHYGPGYGPPEPVEYMPPVYIPPQAPMPPPTHHTPHQFNVHAKNFVQGQHQINKYVPDKTQEYKPPTTVSQPESLPMKDLKISKGPSSPKERTDKPAPEKVSPSPKESNNSKPTWVPHETKVPDVTVQNQNTTPAIIKSFPPTASANMTAGVKIPPVVGKSGKGPAAPFSGAKQTPKPSVPQAAVPVQQTVTPKPPFANRQKRENNSNRSPTSDNNEERPSVSVEHVRREPPLPPSKAPMPISITLHSQGPPVIVSNKPPFGHSRKAALVQEPPPVPQPPPPAPTASDFPPPPTPRNRGEPLPTPVVQPQPQPAGKSWASLFSSKTSIATIAPAPVEEPPSPTTTAPPVATNVQKPVAKVPPFDASPSQQVDKPLPISKPVTTAAQTISYSEKTSVNAVSNTNTSPVLTKPVVTPTVNESTPAKEPVAVPIAVTPSPFSDDPNSYRMGEFLSKYQLDSRAVPLMPRGLTNRSNYCYVNAILQALIACPPFYNMLKALPYQTRRGKSATPVIDSMVELCYEFSPMSTSRLSAGAGRGSPGQGQELAAGPALEGGAGLRVLRALRPFPGSEGRQEDAEEFLTCLLNSLNDEMLELMKLVEPEETKESPPQPNGVVSSAGPQPDEEDDDDEWKVMGPRNRGAVERRWSARRTPVADIFRGRTRTRLHRAQPAHAHHDVMDAVQPFFTLQLDIERSNTVKDALELLAGKDTLEGVSDAWQQLSIEQLPVVLLLHLKCFQLDADGHTAKIVKSIDFPVDLKIDPKIISSKQKYTQKQRLYKLFAVVYHEGVEAVKGHYLTDTFHGQAGWIRYDDSTVTQVTDAQVLKPKPPRMPYLLMYRRHDTLPVPHRAPVKPE